MQRESMGGEGIDTSKAYSQAITSYADVSTMHYTPSTVGSIHHPSNQSNMDPTQNDHMNANMYPNQMMNAVTCLVCYNAQVNIILEPCQHQFHVQCIDRWLNKDKVCPVCWIPIQNHRPIVAHYPGQAGIPRGVYPGNHKGMHPDAANGAVGTPGGPAGANGNGGNNNGGGLLSGPASSILPAQAAANMEHPNPPGMRKGKWTAEESAYCDRLIEEFKKGNLPLAEGTTLRTFLSKLLNCDPMRISKKYTGDQCIGKIIFRRREDELTKEEMESIRRDLAELEKTYLEREQYNQRRREKRLESELSRDKNRFLAAARNAANPIAAFNASSAATAAAVAASANVNGVRGPAQQMPVSMSQGMTSYAQTPANVMTPSAPGHTQQQFQQRLPQMTPHQQQQMMAQVQAQARAHHAQAQAQSLAPPPRHPVPNHPNPGMHHPHPPSSNPSMQTAHSFPGNNAQGNRLTPATSGGLQPKQEYTETQSEAPPSRTPPSASGNDLNSLNRVSSIDSFGCLFPRVASIDGFGSSNNLASYASDIGDQPGGMVKSISIGDGLSAYFPRIQSLEQLSSLLQDQAPSSPKGSRNQQDNKDASSMKPDPANEQNAEAERQANEEIRDADLSRRLSPNNNGSSYKQAADQANQIQIPKPLSKMPRSSSGIFPRIPSMDKLPRVPSMDKLSRVPSMDKLPRIPSMDKLPSVDRIPRIASMDKLPRVPSMDRLSRVPSSSDMLSRFGSSDHLSSFPSFSNLSGLSSSASYDKLSALASGGAVGGGAFRSGFPRNSSIEDILSLVASSESSGGLSSSASNLQLSALAVLAGEESAANERKRKMESMSSESGSNDSNSALTELKKSKVST
ncbi:hypothetical protein Poli38472_004499 [Pythium oligandrum]|uniref:RING-type domain-containing protein n=1 Tax=Pythium oligandrum TaxID=41045 RepID=A0A8K1FDI0_PYTOL|nr:hypothetical protein Poli38472_004499 [Pythium oligandrum]|eukprot:TMW59430.1 hypothetical protein Poli38472_004499 [Pythium oligandrum]